MVAAALNSLKLVDGAQLVGGVAALYALLVAARAWWRVSFGRRRARYRALRRLGTGAQLDFFVSVLGEPPTIRRSVELELTQYGAGGDEVQVPGQFLESFFVQPDHVVQSLSDADGTVVAYTVSATSRSFRPTFHAPRPFSTFDQLRMYRKLGRRWRWWRPLIRVKLNRTRFDRAVPSEREQPVHERYAGARAWMGARAWHYAEQHSFGNPGHYQTFILALSSACDPPRVNTDALGHVVAEINERIETIAEDWRYAFDDETTAVTEHGRRFRRESVVAIWGVIGPAMQVKDFRINMGPHGDEIRTVL